MQDRFQLAQNGQELQTSDVNLVAKEAALADDRVLAELLRLAPFTGSSYAKGILPFGYTSLAVATATVQGGTGGVTINPFRAIVGSRSLASAGAADNWQDIRSAVFTGTTTLSVAQALAANASGNPRWDLVYAAVAVEANGASITRYQKDATTKVVTAANIVTTLKNVVTIGVVQGTAAASPVWPSLPSDAGGTFYIPLAYVRVPNGFTGASTVLSSDIAAVAPTLAINRAAGVTNTAWTNKASAPPTAQQQSWGSTGTRPKVFMPTTSTGSDRRLFAVGLLTGSETHASGDTIDDSRDWRNLITQFTVMGAGAGSEFVWNNPATGNPVPYPAPTVAPYQGLGNTVVTGSRFAARVNNTVYSVLAATSTVTILADDSTGVLKVQYTGAPNCNLVFVVDFFGPVL